LLFNAHCPNAHYNLQLNIPADRRILAQLLIINSWERRRAIDVGHADLSQHGDHECFRNVVLNASPMIWRSEEASVPPRGELVFDYCSPFHPPLDSEATSDNTIDAVIASLTSASVDSEPKLAALRTVLHSFVLVPGQSGRIIEVLPPAESSLENSSSNLSFRIDAFVVLYARCKDISGLLQAEGCGLYTLSLLTRVEVLNVRSRLGRLRT